MCSKIFVAVVLFVCALGNASAQTISLATLDWPPYIGPGVKNQGYVTEIVNAAFKHSGDKTEIEYMPWARAVKVTEDGSVDGLFPEYYSDDRATTHAFSDPFPGGPIGFLKRKDMDIPVARLKNLTDLTIGVVRGYVNTEEFDKADYLNKDAVTSDLINIKKLARGRVDLIVIDKFVARHLIGENLPKAGCRLEFVEPALENKDLYVAFSRKASNYKRKLVSFNQGLKAIKKNGILDKILKSHNFK